MPMEVEVVIRGRYTVPDEAMKIYGSPKTADEAARVDQTQYDEGHVAAEEIIGWCDDDTLVVEIKGVP